MPCALHIAEMRRRMIDVEAAAAVVVVSDDEGDVTDGPEHQQQQQQQQQRQPPPQGQLPDIDGAQLAITEFSASDCHEAYVEFMINHLKNKRPANMEEFELWWAACLTISKMKSERAFFRTFTSITEPLFEHCSASACAGVAVPSALLDSYYVS